MLTSPNEILKEILAKGMPVKPELMATKNFSWAELLINQKDVPAIGVLENLLKIAKVLQVYRDKVFKMPITITNGWRSESYNINLYARINKERLAKGLPPVPVANKSAHIIGHALDFTVKNWTPAMVFDVMDRVHKGGVERTDGNWSHIDNRKQIIRFSPCGSILNSHFKLSEHEKLFGKISAG
jgi:hypothetical protein